MLTRPQPERNPRRACMGMGAGKGRVAEDFDDPLPEGLLKPTEL